MRIEQLIPIRFGRLRGEPLTLRPGLNLICGPNESGKSTYAALIRFLLYGFSSQAKSKQNPLPERAKYVPWSEAGAAGSMVYREGGRLYRLHREAKGSKQAFAVSDEATAAPVAFMREPGEELFGLSRGTFESTAFFGQSLLSAISMEEIESKLRNIATGADENVSCQKALARLKNARNAIDNGRRNGALIALCAERDALHAQLERLDAQTERYRRLQQELIEKKRSRAALAQRIEALCAQANAHEQQRLGDLEQRRAALVRERAELTAVRESLARELCGAGREELDRAKEVLYRYEAQAAGRPQPDSAPPMPKGAPVWLWVLAVLLGLGGLALLLVRYAVPGAAALGAGLCLAALGGVLSASGRKKRAAWSAAQDRARADAAAYETARAGLKGELNEFFGHFGIADEMRWKPFLRELEQKLSTYMDTEARIREIALRMDALATKNPAGASATAAAAALAEAQRQAAQMDTEIAAMQGELQVRLEHRQAADGIQSRINELDEREAELRRRLDVYNLALTALERAHDEMTRLFAPALNERAAKLFSYLSGPARTVKIDSAGAVRIEEDGAVHEIGYYSTGTADAAYIAMRLACIELLYTESKPPLVFDDSLCNLDPARKAAAFALLARLSERYQILYFTCHDETAALGDAPYFRIALES